MLIQSPCLNCPDRKKPKTCESKCNKWNQYRATYTKMQEMKNFIKYGGRYEKSY